MNKDKKNITSIAIGGFDGMHIAHQSLFNNLTSNGAIIAIETGHANMTPKEQREKCTTFPIFYYELNDIKNLSGKEFIKLLKSEFPKLKKIVVGFDFCFGKNRANSTEELKSLFDGEVVVVNEISINDIAIHSRIIREYIKNGDFETANTLLGRKYEIKGTQIKGQGLGKSDFVPTINLDIKEYLLPNEGVYITKTKVDNVSYPSISFLGHRVTTDGNFAVETHILNKDISAHNSNISIKFFKKLRDNQKFDSFEKLKEQIVNDINDCKIYFNLNL
ncbi:riboflavin biosynthesis protein RibF [Arcobacter nitrofigilis DSM 7299]|uniref:Riboflavin biosynthesis protein n=1 Tax=Arcobacter nitrofigilis (strain ATCC 33309 / DSM 7299 / CCUG 15893 / LMG 7604 / NCTC 12251 / CI) TaxID=572480 RepID=D5V0Z1_ARCNC|nr:bifunctional riboflavin kinase/FAD synthetase [Arcobacter nitrofigilis]ADG93953.1 riboflavin biosynthesis protein RibF [Arcobacter nitrofigilis DSM 7299]